MAANEIQRSDVAKKEYMDLWTRSGVTIASSCLMGPAPFDDAFEIAVDNISHARAYANALPEDFEIVLTSDDIERVYKEGKRGVNLNFQDTTPFGSNLDRVDYFYNLGLRIVQLTYNLRNLVGDGCTELYKTGLSYYGKALVERLNDLGMIVDVSHSSQQVGWDALETSRTPIMISHSSSNAVCYHDRGKDDDLAKAVADRGGFFGVVIVPGFVQNKKPIATLDDFAEHIMHLVNVMGIDHVGIGNDICGNGPETGDMFEYPDNMPATIQYFKEHPDVFNWSGFRPEHRITDEYKLADYKNFGDWPNLTVKLAEKGFNEEELRKLIGLNYLKYYKEVIG
jgi:membrane dipeptidase